MEAENLRLRTLLRKLGIDADEDPRDEVLRETTAALRSSQAEAAEARADAEALRREIAQRRAAETRQAVVIRLGDELRATTTPAACILAAARVFGPTLDVGRAGYATVDIDAGTYQVEEDWCTPVFRSAKGRYSLSSYPIVSQRLKNGNSVAISDTGATDWIGADEAATFQSVGLVGVMLIPLLDRGRLVAILFAHTRQPRMWTAGEIELAHGIADRTHAALGKVKAEADQRLLNEEMSHRLKNTLSMVSAIAAQTLRGVSEKAAVQAFQERILTLSTAHDLLLQQNWTAARLLPLIKGAVALHGDGSRFDLDGPDLRCVPQAALSLSLLLHELATNAVKYGSLSAEAGRVRIAWWIDPVGPEATMILTWTEQGGPPAVAPDRRGFGSRLIGLGLAGAGDARLRFETTGLEAEFRAPLASISDLRV